MVRGVWFAVRGLWPVVYYSALAARVMFVVWCLFVVPWRLLFAGCCLLFVVWWLVVVDGRVCSSLFIVCCVSLCVVCCVLLNCLLSVVGRLVLNAWC